MAAILERVQRGAVGDDERRGGLEVHLRRQRPHVVRGHQALLCESTAPGRTEHAVALLEAGDAASYFLDYPGQFHSRREGKRRFHLVETPPEGGIGEVDKAGLNLDHYLFWARLRRGNFLHLEAIDRAIFAAEQRFHFLLPFLAIASRRLLSLGPGYFVLHLLERRHERNGARQIESS